MLTRRTLLVALTIFALSVGLASRAFADTPTQAQMSAKLLTGPQMAKNLWPSWKRTTAGPSYLNFCKRDPHRPAAEVGRDFWVPSGGPLGYDMLQEDILYYPSYAAASMFFNTSKNIEADCLHELSGQEPELSGVSLKGGCSPAYITFTSAVSENTPVPGTPAVYAFAFARCENLIVAVVGHLDPDEHPAPAQQFVLFALAAAVNRLTA